MQTLSYLLSSRGMASFQSWYLGFDILKPIWQDLDNYTLMLLSTRWAEEANRDKTREFIREYLKLFLEMHYKKPANEIYKSWIDSVAGYCYQGGYGYAFSYPGAPHHWVIREEYINQVVPILAEIQLAACICDQYINIADKPDWEKWTG